MRYQILYFSLNLHKDIHTSNYTLLWQSWIPSSGVAKKGIIFFSNPFSIKKNTSNNKKVHMNLTQSRNSRSCMLVRWYFSHTFSIKLRLHSYVDQCTYCYHYTQARTRARTHAHTKVVTLNKTGDVTQELRDNLRAFLTPATHKWSESCSGRFSQEKQNPYQNRIIKLQDQTSKN